MKKSQRYIRNTFITLAVLLVAFIVANRVVEPPKDEAWPEGSSAEELATLRDFSVLRIAGDFDVTVEQGNEYSVSFVGLDQKRSFFKATQEGDTLIVEGYGHRLENSAAQLRITLPLLQMLHAESGNGVVIDIRGITTTAELNLESASTVRLINNTGALQLNARAVQNIELDAQSAANTTMSISSAGTRITTAATALP